MKMWKNVLSRLVRVHNERLTFHLGTAQEQSAVNGNQSGNNFPFGVERLVTQSHFLMMKFSTHYSKSQIFVQIFNFDKTPTFSRVFHPNFFCQFFS